ncbi:unnamed protein product [Mucor hiemalis]
MKREQMSISSLTSSQMPRYSYSQNPELQCDYYYSSNNSHHPGYQHAITRSSTTCSSERSHSMNSPPPSPHSIDYSHNANSSHHRYYGDDDDQSMKNNYNISVQERRQRNKAASAKYRLKKNIQQHEMRNMINRLSERNAILERQLRDVQHENQRLRTTADKLRGKYVAKTLLRQWIGCQRQDRMHLPVPTCSDDNECRMLPPPPNMYAMELPNEDDIDHDFDSLYHADI